MEGATAWKLSFTPTSFSFQVVALFQGQGKGNRGRTPHSPHCGRIGDLSASPISRSNEKLPRPSKLPLSPLSWARSRVQTVSALSLRSHTSPCLFPGKGPLTFSPRPLFTPGLRVGARKRRWVHPAPSRSRQRLWGREH